MSSPAIDRLAGHLTGIEIPSSRSVDGEKEVSKIIIISLRLIGRAGKETFNLAGCRVKNGPHD